MRKRRVSHPADIHALSTATDIDALYGLEPVFEPGTHSGTEPTCFVTISCPSCGESYAIEVDLTNGEFSHIEDCQVCCQPMQVSVQLDDQGQLTEVRTQRLDEL